MAQIHDSNLATNLIEIWPLGFGQHQVNCKAPFREGVGKNNHYLLGTTAPQGWQKQSYARLHRSLLLRPFSLLYCTGYLNDASNEKPPASHRWSDY